MAHYPYYRVTKDLVQHTKLRPGFRRSMWLKRSMTLVAALPILIGLLFVCCAVSFAGGDSVPSNDRLPSGDWTYDAMGSLASDGLVPGCSARVFQGDRLFTRFEMARLIETVMSESKTSTLTVSQTVLLNSLVDEFKSELKADTVDAANLWQPSSTLSGKPYSQFMGHVQNVAGSNNIDKNDNPSIAYKATTRLDLSNHIFANISMADNGIKGFYQTREVNNPDSLFIHGSGNNYTWSIGREYMQWGPAYSGSLILSDNAPSMYRIFGSTNVDLGKMIGKLKISQFTSKYQSDGETTYLFGRRYEKAFLNNRLYLGFSETAKSNTKPEAQILVMPFYLYQQMYDSKGSNINNLMAVDALYESKNKNQVYGQFLADEMTSPGVIPGDHIKTVKKTGYIVGFYVPKVTGGSNPYSLRAEYLYLDGGTYDTNASRDNALKYTYDGFILGHPFGPNTQGIYLRGEHSLNDKASLIAEYYGFKNTADDHPGYGDRSILSLQLAYDFTPSVSTSLRIAPYKVVPTGAAKEDGVAFELRTSYSF